MVRSGGRAAARRVGVAVLAATLGAGALSANAVAVDETGADDADGRFIVRFVESATEQDVAAARDRAVEAGATISYDYESALTGFAAKLPRAARDELGANPMVTVTPDEVISLFGTQSGAPEALDRIDQRTGTDGRFSFDATGEGVRAYVVDTGIRADHEEFGGRVLAGQSFAGGNPQTDCAGEMGHGTHVASTLGGRTYGVAKDVRLVPVKVFGCSGSSPVSQVIAGIDWMIEEHNRVGGPAVANLSLGTPENPDLDEAVRNAIDAGITVVTAAGNNTQGGNGRCEQSPARVADAITVGAVDAADRLASFSNFGDCVDLFAPGKDIRAASADSTASYTTKSGTSMATPLVAGVAATYLENAPKASPSGVRSVLVDAATTGVLNSLGSGSPNRMLYSQLPTGNRAPKVSDLSVSAPARGKTIGSSTVPLKVKWRASDPEGDAITSYRVQRSYNNGKSWTTVDTTRSTKSIVSARPDGQLRLRVRATDERGEDSPNVQSAKLDLDLLQQNKGRFTKGWKSDRGSNLSQGSARISKRDGAAVTFRFTGRAVRWIGSKDRDHGKAKVYIDGRYVGKVDLYSAQREQRQVLFSDSVRRGKHTLRIVVTGQQDRRATNDKVGVDAIVVLD